MSQALTPNQIAALSPASFAAEPMSFFTSLTAAQANAITVAQIRAASAAQVAAVPASAFAGLSNAVLKALTPAQIALLASPALNALTVTQFALFSSSQIAALTISQINSLGKIQLQAIPASAFTSADVAGLTPSAMGLMTATQFQALFGSNVANLTMTQIAALNASELGSLTKTEVQSLTSADIAAMGAAQIAALPGRLFGYLSNTALKTLNAAQMAALTPEQLNALTSAQVALFSPTQIVGLTGNQLNSMYSTLRAIAPADFTASQIAGLNPYMIGNFSASQFQYLFGSHLASLSPEQITYLSTSETRSLTAAQINSLSSIQLQSLYIGGLSKAQLGALTTTQLGVLTAMQVGWLTSDQLNALSQSQINALNPLGFGGDQFAGLTAQTLARINAAEMADPIFADAASREVKGAISFAGLLGVLQDANAGAMTTARFEGLQQLASELNIAGGISTTAYAQQMFDNVVLGNKANQWWNGGSNTAVSLGNLSAQSSQTQFAELIGKWFLGTDNPGIGSSEGSLPTNYVAVSGSLWGTNGPSSADVSQGSIGDCYFAAALAELAIQDPTAIENMIHQNSNGAYAVEFLVDGQADWVTVNNQLPEYTKNGKSGYVAMSDTGALWAPLIEKAYVELTEQSTFGNLFAPNPRSGANYNNIVSGSDNGLQAITGQSDTWLGLPSGDSSTALHGLLTQLQSAFASKEEILFTCETNNSAANLVSNHMYFVTGVNVNSGTVSLGNPWGANGAGSGLQMSFTDSISSLVTQSPTGLENGFYVTSGKPTLG